MSNRGDIQMRYPVVGEIPWKYQVTQHGHWVGVFTMGSITSGLSDSTTGPWIYRID